MISWKYLPLGVSGRRISLETEAGVIDEWTEAEITRDLKDFSGSFAFVLREAMRTGAALEWVSASGAALVRKGMRASIRVDNEIVLVGWVETIDRSIDADHAEIRISGRDKSGDLVDCAAAPDGPAEFRNVTLEEAARRIAKPFGLSVRSEIDAGEPFPRYSIDLAEAGYSAIEKGARQRHALVTSDGVGGIVITRTGASRAPADLRLPGNVRASSFSESDAERYSETVVRGQAERAGKRREGRKAALDASAEPLAPGGRRAGDGSATTREGYGTALTGRAKDEEIARYRPIVHLTRAQGDDVSVQDEADWRMRTRRAESDELTHLVHDFRAGAAGELWRVNQTAFVDDAFQNIARDLLISRTTMRYAQEGPETELVLVSPEAFDAEPVGRRRTNRGTAKTSGGPLDATAEGL